jgi:hypothetical protein
MSNLCGYFDDGGNCIKDNKRCKYAWSWCPKLKAERRGMKQLKQREETRK